MKDDFEKKESAEIKKGDVTGKSEAPLKLLVLYYIDRFLLFFLALGPVLVFFLSPVPLIEFYKRKMLFVFLFLIFKIMIMFFLTKEFLKIKYCTRPEYLRFYREKKHQKLSSFDNMLVRAYYCCIIYDLDTADKIMNEIDLFSFLDSRYNQRSRLGKVVAERHLKEYIFLYDFYHFLVFDIISIVEIEKIFMNHQLTEDMKKYIEETKNGVVRFFNGDLKIREQNMLKYYENNENYYLYLVAISDCINNDAHEYEKNREIILQGNSETFFYKILENNTMHSLSEIIDSAKSKLCSLEND